MQVALSSLTQQEIPSLKKKNRLSLTQKELPSFFPKPIKQVCLQIPLHTKNRNSLSETLTKKHLEKHGWKVWRGGSFNAHKEEDAYPNVKRAYEQLNCLMEKHHPLHAETLRYFCHVHHGMPDFVAYKDGKFKFVECKLIYESLSGRQKQCITKLSKMGFAVEIYRIVDKSGSRKAAIDLSTGKKKTLEEQAKLKFFAYYRSRKRCTQKGNHQACPVVHRENPQENPVSSSLQ